MISKAIKTPFGSLYLEASPKGITALYWKKPSSIKKKTTDEIAQTHLDKAEQQLKQYFLGQRTQFDIKYDLKGTEFQLKVWKALSQIPYGKTYSYKDLAIRAGSPKAFRAVGSANGKNPIPILIPCHRVIHQQGEIGGYSGQGGIKTKRFLLDLESQTS